MKATRSATTGPRSASLRPLVLAAILFGVWTAPAASQSIDATTYPFTFGSGAALEAMSSGTTQLIGPDQDNAASSVVPIGFEFWFSGTRQTSFSVNSNGLLRLGSTAVQGASTNNLASVLNAPQIAPYWDDLWIGTNGKVHYKVVGSAPNRKLVVEWLNMQVPRLGAGSSGSATFQCWLYETTGKIEFVYDGGMATNTPQGGASIGIGSTGGTFASITAAYPSVDYATANNANAVAIPSGTRYTFSPQVPAAPTSLGFSQVGGLTMTLVWADNATNEVGYAIWRSTDGANYDFITQTAAGATSSVQSGLTPGTTYYWIVRAVSEGAVSDPLAGSQATSAAGNITTAGSGNWSSTVPGAPWPGGLVPTSSDNVTIADGHTVTVDAAANCYGLTVGQGASGVLRFENATARTLTVVGDVLVSPGAVLASATSGTQTAHVLSLGGSLTNQGTLDFSTNGNQAGAALGFTGGSNASLGGGGPVTNVRAITAAKSSGATVTLNTGSFTVRGQTADSLGFLTLTSGTFHLAGVFATSSKVFTTPNYTLAAGTTFWLDNPNFTVLASDSSATVRGLRVSAGIFQVGTRTGHSLQLASGSQVTIEGGEVRVAGRLAVSSASNTVTYLQTGGTVTVNTVGHTSTSQASFDLGVGTTSSTTISGGTIVLQKASTSGSGPRDYRNEAATQNVTGGTLQLGSVAAGAPQTYFISGTVPNLVISNLAGGHTARLSAATTVAGSTQIAAGATLDLNGSRFTQSIGSLVNDGTLTGSASNSELYFAGSVTPQSYSGAGAIPAPLAVLCVDNPAGVSIAAGVAANIVTRRVNLIRGVLGNSQKITLGAADTATAVTQIGAAGVAGTAGSYDASPIFNPGAGGLSVSYLQEGAPRTTGYEIPLARLLKDLTVNNPGGSVTVSGGALTLTRSLALTAGLLRTTAANLVVVSDTASSIAAGSTQSYVDGPLAIAVTTTVDTLPASRTFAIGRDGAFRPLALSRVVTGGAQQVFTAELITGSTGGTPTAPLQALASTRYWKIGNSAALNDSARVQLTFGTDDHVGALSNLRVAQASAPAGSYADLGGVSLGDQSSGTVVSTANLTPGSDYFVVATAGALASTWDGGAGTSNWSDAANWNPDGVPGTTTDVTLSLPVPTTIHVAGSAAVGNLTVNSNATLQLDSGMLSVNGGYTQSGGAVQLVSGTLHVGGTTSINAGAMNLGSGTLTTGDDVVVSGGSLSLSSGTFVADSTLTIGGGTVSLDTGTLELKGSLSRDSGNFYAGTGTTILSGDSTQDISGGLTFYNLVLRNGGSGRPKRFQSFLPHTVNNDLTVESTAQMALSSSSATQLTVWGNLRYSGLTGGSSIGSLTINLAGIGKTFSGVPPAGPEQASLAAAQRTAPAEPATVEVSFLTDPTRAQPLAEMRDGKPLLALENTYEKRRGQVEQLLRTADPAKRLVINLDDMTLVRNPESALSIESQSTATLPMPVTISPSASYALDGNVTMASGQTLTIGGRLDCGTFTVGGTGGKVTVNTFGTLATATASATGLAATVLTTGTNTYTDGCIVEYNAAGDQTVNATTQPASAMIRTAGSGTKTLSAAKTITASSGGFLSNGALFVGPGTTFADGGFRLSFTTTQIANVIVQGIYLSTGSGSISYEAGAFNSNIQAVNGTAFGDLLMNFASSTSAIDLNANGTANLTFRNLTFGGTAGSGTAGGTLRFSETGTTNVTVTGKVTISPATATNTGGGFGGTAGQSGQVTLQGNLSSTSTAATQPIVNGTGTNKLIFAGASRESLTLAANTTIFTGSTLQLANPAGLALGSSSKTYTIGSGGALDLGSGNINTGTNTLALSAGVPLTRTTGRVVGPLRIGFATGPAAASYYVGTETGDTPVSLAFGNVTTAGNVLVTTTGSEHPNISTSNLNSAKSVNRYFTVTNTGVVFDSASVGLTFLASDVDAGADPSSFAVRKFNSPTWSPTVIAARTPTSIQAKRITSFSDFAIGEGASFYLTPSAGANGTISPTGQLVVAPGASQTYTITPNANGQIIDVAVDGFSVGPVSSYAFSNVTADHSISATFNTPPVLSGVPASASIPESAPYTFTATATDGDVPAQTLTFSLVGAPVGAAINPATGVFTWTPTEAQGGASYPFTVRVSDGFTSTNASITLTVTEVNVAPVLSGVPATASIAEAVPYTFTATATDADLPAQTLTFSLVGAPAGASISPSTGAFTWTPSLAQGGASYPFTVRVSDGVTNTDAATTLTVTLTVYTITASAGANGRVSPSGAVSVTRGDSLVVAVAPDSGYTVADVQVDGASVGAVTSYTFHSVAASHTISATFAPSQAVTVGPAPTAISTAHTCVTVPVNISRITPLAIRGFSVTFSLPPNLTLCSGTSGITEGTFLSSFGGTTFLVRDLGGGSYAADGVILGGTCGQTALTGNLFNVAVTSSAPSDSGAITLVSAKLRDCDNVALFAGLGGPATVRIDNTPPSVALTFPNGGEVVTIDSTRVVTWTTTDNAGPGTADLAYSIDAGASFPNAIATGIADVGSYAWVVPNTRSTNVRVRVTAHDVNGNTAADASNADFEIRETNVPPVLAAIGNRTVNEGELLSFTPSATDANLPAQALRFSLGAGAPAGAAIDSVTGVFAWTPTEAQGPGDYPIAVRVTDNGAPPLADAETLSVHVNEVNTPPALADVPAAATVPELAPYGFTATASDADLPPQPLRFSLAGAPAGASIDSISGAFAWTPSEAQGPGSYTFSVRVSDGFAGGAPALRAAANPLTEGFNITSSGELGPRRLSVRLPAGMASVEVPITVTVSEVNAAPVLSGVPASATIPELAAYTFTASATDADLPAQTLTFSLVGAPSGASIDGSSGVFSWTPSEAQGPGTYPFTVRVSDGVANTDAVITLTVTEVNAAPVLSGVPASATIPELAAYTFTASATDTDLPAQTLTFSLVGAPTGATIDGSTGVFNWTPTETQGPGAYEFSVRVSDGVTAATIPLRVKFGASEDRVSLASTAFQPARGDLGRAGISSEGGPPGILANSDAAITLTVDEVNAAPALSGVPTSATIPELAPYSFTATATDADFPAQTLTFSLAGTPPAGASIDGSSGVFSWTPSEAQGPGSYPFTVRVSDGVTNTDAAITLTVSEMNAAPVLAAIGNKSVNEGSALSFTASASDGDLPPQGLTFSLDAGAPAGAAIDPSTGAFAWTPTEAQGPADYPVTVRVTDSGSPPLDDSETITVHVAEVNLAPVLSSVPASATIPELSAYGFTATATDADVPAQTLTFSLVGAPSGASINASSGAFTWTPSEAQGPGSYPFTVRVSDGIANTDAAVTLTVTEVNSAPALANVPASATIPEQAAYTFTATATDADVPGQTLTFSLVNAPAGASIGGASGVFTWTPTEAQGPGSYPFTVRASDGIANTDAAVTLTVSEVNVAPVLSAVPASGSIPELVAYSFTATATDADVPTQTLTFSLVGAPTGASIGSASGVFTWTPTEAQGPGSYPFTVRVSDGVTNTDAAITLSVAEGNVAPVLSGVPASATIAELSAYTFTASATDADLPAQTLTFSLVGAPPAGASIAASTGVFTWTPSEAQGPGSYSFTVRVTDGVTNTDAAITLNVAEVNSAPVLAGVAASATIPELAGYAFTASATDADAPAQTLTYSLDAGAPSGAAINPSTGAFSWTPSEAQGPGDYPITVRVTDDGSPPLNDAKTISVHVDEVNMSPLLSGVPALATIAELVAFSFTAAASDADLPAQTLTFSVVGAPAGASINPSTGVFSWTPTEAQGPGSYPMTVRVTDGTATASSDMTVVVQESNSAPVLAAIGDKSVNEGTQLSFTASATDSDDPPQTLTYSLDAGAPAGASIDGSSGLFAWTPTEAQGPGNYSVTVRVTDNGSPPMDDSETITIHVDEVNVAPVLSGVPASATIPELAAYGFTASASDADLPAQTLTFSLLGAPAGATIGSASGVFSWTPTEAQGPGTYPFTVRVSDGVANTDAAITLTVTDVNSAPVLAAIGNKTVNEQALLSFTASATDGDLPAQALAYSLDAGAPSGASINASSGAFTWTPTEAQGPGDYPVTVRVTDNGSPPLDDFETITVHVDELNVAPTLSGVPASATIPELAAYGFTATSTDPDVPVQAPTFSLVNGPPGASIGSSSGVFSWTPSEAQGPGVYSFTVRVSDGVANTDAGITLTVTDVNSAPVLAAIGNKTVNEGALLSFTASATDGDLPAQTLRYSLDAGAPAGASVDSSTGAFTWTPTEAQGPNDYSVTVRVTDDGSPPLDDFETITVHVNEVNVAPTLSGVPASATIPELVAYGFTATASDVDVPVQTLTFSLVGAPPGASIGSSSGAFTWTPSEAQGPGVYSFTVRVSDGVANTDAGITITVQEVNIAAITDLTAARLATGNDADGTTKITLSWSPTPGGTTVEVFRAGYGSYPEYDDGSGAVPATPTYPPGAPWVATSVTAPGQTDEPATRDFYYYVAFVHGAGLNVSAASNRPPGALNYHLGDVSDGVTAGQGDNVVNTADISLLGAHYGLTGAAVAPYAYLDVGPTTDGSPNTLPTTDDVIDFEDLILFSITYDVLSSPARPAAAPAAAVRPAATPGAARAGSQVATADVLTLTAPTHVGPGDSPAATLSLAGSGRVQGLSVRLEWDPAIVRPLAAHASTAFGEGGGVVLSSRPGTLDAALLGVRGAGITGEVEIGTVAFEVVAAGDPAIRIAGITGRDAGNHAVEIASQPVVGVPGPQRFIPAATGLAPPAPNPFRQSTAFTVSLAQAGHVRLELYSLDGRRVRTLLDEMREAGEYHLTWDGRDGQGSAAAPGVYFVRLVAGSRNYTRNIVYLR